MGMAQSANRKWRVALFIFTVIPDSFCQLIGCSVSHCSRLLPVNTRAESPGVIVDYEPQIVRRRFSAAN